MLRDLADDDEFVATVPRDEVTGAHTGQQALCDFLQHPVAGLMAELVVHTLEIVEVDEQHRAP